MNTKTHTNRTSLRTLAMLFCVAMVAASGLMAASGVVNINQADTATLQMLPRVGPAVAQRIIDFRDANGAFKDKSDLLLVRGIGSKTFDLIEPYVTLDGESTLGEKVRVARSESTSEEQP